MKLNQPQKDESTYDDKSILLEKYIFVSWSSNSPTPASLGGASCPDGLGGLVGLRVVIKMVILFLFRFINKQNVLIPSTISKVICGN